MILCEWFSDKIVRIETNMASYHKMATQNSVWSCVPLPVGTRLILISGFVGKAVEGVGEVVTGTWFYVASLLTGRPFAALTAEMKANNRNVFV